MIREILNVCHQRTRLLLAAGSVLALGACAVAPSPAYAQAGSNIKIVVMAADDIDTTIPASTSVSRAASASIQDIFQRQNYQVVGKEQIEAAGIARFPDRMSEVDALKNANAAKKSGKPEFDVVGVVVYTIHPIIQTNRTARGDVISREVTLDVTGKVYNAGEGFLGKFGPKTFGQSANLNCDQEAACISMVARQIANDLAAWLAQGSALHLNKLTGADSPRPSRPSPQAAVQSSPQPGPAPQPAPNPGRNYEVGLTNTYKFRFEHFASTEVLRLKGVMEGEWPGFVRAEGLKGGAPIWDYAYVSRAPQDKLVEWITLTIADMGYNPDRDLTITNIGTEIHLIKAGTVQPPAAAPAGRFR